MKPQRGNNSTGVFTTTFAAVCRIGVALIALTLWAALASGSVHAGINEWTSNGPKEQPKQDWQIGTKICLELRPFLPRKAVPAGAVFVLLHGDGKARVVHYSPYQLAVVAAYQGNLPKADVMQLLTKTQQADFREALQHKSFASTGVEEGDSFYLSLEFQDAVVGEVSGLLQNAPKVVHALVENLLELEKGLEAAPLAHAYVKSEPIAEERFEKLRQKGTLRFISILEFPPEIQPVVIDAISHPRDFLALSRGQYNQLLKWRSHGDEFFVVNKNSGYQLTLFRS